MLTVEKKADILLNATCSEMSRGGKIPVRQNMWHRRAGESEDVKIVDIGGYLEIEEGAGTDATPGD